MRRSAATDAFSNGHLGFEERLGLIVDAECNRRQANRIAKSIRNAGFSDHNAAIEGIEYIPERKLDYHVIEELSKCEWIDQHRNLVITGQTGSGKTYIAIALCISALRQFKTVRYIRASQLIDDMNRAETLGTYREELAVMAGYALLVIDDFGLMQLDMNKCRNLFEVIESRDSHRSPFFMLHSFMPLDKYALKAYYNLVIIDIVYARRLR